MNLSVCITVGDVEGGEIQCQLYGMRMNASDGQPLSEFDTTVH